MTTTPRELPGTTPAPALTDLTDLTDSTDRAALAAQPIGYWSWVANKAVIRHIQSAMARTDINQPQWWTLNHVEGAENGLTREEVSDRLRPYLDLGPELVEQAVDSLVARGWLAAGDEDRLHLTDAGREAKHRTKDLVGRLRAEIHEGITDEEYVATLTVLQRMISNVGGTTGKDRPAVKTTLR
ncbi:MarR family winged helix-turn-helix transcriptional regulator [Streptomyces sp. ISL-11]|uniref:MarR family winged helix-turn-helix transcriptional regulator n=1 Tax=Streptomyces sp. ISL-11 TaxID=2819174 RepID=UPI001BE6A3B1|nr:MarR family winged helix-turn-helix transcriptional regulator [Streptomyces sp. ISL-11]MBT2384075.1 winged helix-turn-helix transcriptional regulator [Streptomyces sp. ISL-11]